MSEFRSMLRKGVALTLLPPLGVSLLYAYGSSTGCSGGNCAGAMLAVGMLGLIAIPLSLSAAAITLILVIGEAVSRAGARLRGR